MESWVKCSIEGFSEAISSDAQIFIIFDGFSSGKFAFVNPIYQLP